MGNHGSRRDQRKVGKHGGKAANALNRVEELRGPSVDSYDKLIAWLAEMAESDNVELDTSVFVSQLNRVCGVGSQSNFLEVSTTNVSGSAASSSGGGGGGGRAPNVRQNSASCDSHASSEQTRCKGSMRSEDFLDPKSALKSGASSRQNTFSDDLEEEEDPALKNASMESLYSNTDRDSELGSMSAYDSAYKGRGYAGRHSPFLPLTVNGGLHCFKKRPDGGPYSSSTGNLEAYDQGAMFEGVVNNRFKRKSVSLLDLTPPTVMPRFENIPKLVLTREDDKVILPPPPEVKTSRKKLGAKSLSLNAWSRRPAKFERQMSLQTDPNPPGFMATPFAVPRPLAKPPPPTVAEIPEVPVFLDDALLDGNLADILFSVEALWPKK